MKKRNSLRIALTLATVFVVLWGICNASSLLSAVKAVAGVLAPLLAGLSIAFILNLPLRFFERIWIKLFSARAKVLRRGVCIILCLLLIMGSVALLIGIIAPEIITTVKDKIIPRIPFYADELRLWYGALTGFLARFSIELPELKIDPQTVITKLTEWVSAYGTVILDKSMTIATSAFGFLVDAVCAIVIAIYVLAQKEKLGRQARKLLYSALPEKTADRALTLARLTEKTFSRFTAGQLVEAFILGSLCFIGMLIFKMPYPLIISVIMTVTALIPIFGAFIGTGIGAAIILFESPIKALWFIVFILVLQQVEGNLIYPRVVGSQVGLPGLWVLVAVAVGSEFGIVGMLVAVPLVSLIYTVTRQVVNARIEKKGLSHLFVSSEEPPKPKNKKRRKRKKNEEEGSEEPISEKKPEESTEEEPEEKMEE